MIKKFIWLDYVFLILVGIFLVLSFVVEGRFFTYLMLITLFGIILLRTFIVKNEKN